MIGVDVEIGFDEGDICFRRTEDGYRCIGVMKFPEVENCSCHINPPCYAHTENKLTCTDCGFEVQNKRGIK